MSLRRFASILALALLCLPSPAEAQTGKVVSITVTGSQRFAGEQIAEMCGLVLGDEITSQDIQTAADRLAQLGPFLNVHYRFRPKSADEVEIEFQLEDAPLVPVSFDNFPWFTDDELNAAMKEAVPFYDGAAPEQGSMLDLMSKALAHLLPSRNVKGTIERALLRRADDEGMMMQFKLEGPSLKVNGLRFSDAIATDDRRIRQRLDDVVGKPYSRFAVEMFLREQVRPVYLERGHLQVGFGQPEARFTGDPSKPLADNVLVLVTVNPGPTYKWGGAEWSGAAAFGPAALNTYLGLVPGEAANGNKIEAAFNKIHDEYARRGFLDVRVQSEASFDASSGKVSYRTAVTEGPQYRMGKMIITGLSLAAERLLVEAWRIKEGEVFDRMYFEDFIENGVKLAFGDRPIHYEEPIGRWLRTNPQSKTVDVLLDFK